MPPRPPAKAYAPFDFDLAQAVTTQLVAAFNALPIGKLTQDVVGEIAAQPGVYQLYLNDTLMYVGKHEKSVAERLEEHRWNLSGRRNVDGTALGFKALYIHKNWAPSAHEDVLIQYFREQGACAWNTTGLGNHDPGHNREDTVTDEYHFDVMYPINEEYVPEGVGAGTYNALRLFLLLKERLPYTFRYEAREGRRGYLAGSDKYNRLDVLVPRDGMTTREILETIVQALPNGWQATIFPGRVILYDERRDYAHATRVIRR